jgi:GNAT superfamily N-acetyltransferase
VNPLEPPIEFRRMSAADIEDGLRLCRISGWDQVARDWERFLRPPSEAIVGVRGNRVIGTCGAIRYGSSFAWIGMVLVDPDAQGQGVGASLLTRMTEMLSDIPVMRLDATPAGHPLYLKRGFGEEWRLTRFERRPSVDSGMPMGAGIVQMSPADFAEIAAMDADVFGGPRRDLLEWMYEGAPEYALVARSDAVLAGYVFGRRGFEFQHLGPIGARDSSIAIQLTTACLVRHGNRPFIIDAARHDQAWLDFLERAGFREQRPYIRMHSGGHSPFGQPDRQFAVLGPEFG